MSVVAAPAGEVTLVFTDIEGSTLKWNRYPHVFQAVLDRHNALIRRAITEHNGYEVKTIGDSFMVAFASVAEAAACCLTIQRLVEAESFDEIEEHLRVRI